MREECTGPMKEPLSGWGDIGKRNSRHSTDGFSFTYSISFPGFFPVSLHNFSSSDQDTGCPRLNFPMVDCANRFSLRILYVVYPLSFNNCRGFTRQTIGKRITSFFQIIKEILPKGKHEIWRTYSTKRSTIVRVYCQLKNPWICCTIRTLRGQFFVGDGLMKINPWYVKFNGRVWIWTRKSVRW